jgi:hypothetical protein
MKVNVFVKVFFKSYNKFSRHQTGVGVKVLEPPTKQFYPKCQSPTVLPSSQSTWRITAPSCIGSRPASRQSIRDALPERQCQWSSNTTQTVNKWETAASWSYDSQPARLASRLRERTRRFKATRTNQPDHRPIETASRFIQSGTPKVVILPLPATSSGPPRSTRSFSACAWYHISLAFHSVQSNDG